MNVQGQGSISHRKPWLLLLSLQSHIIKVPVINPDARLSGEISRQLLRQTSSFAALSFPSALSHNYCKVLFAVRVVFYG